MDIKSTSNDIEKISGSSILVRAAEYVENSTMDSFLNMMSLFSNRDKFEHFKRNPSDFIKMWRILSRCKISINRAIECINDCVFILKGSVALGGKFHFFILDIFFSLLVRDSNSRSCSIILYKKGSLFKCKIGEATAKIEDYNSSGIGWKKAPAIMLIYKCATKLSHLLIPFLNTEISYENFSASFEI